MEPSQRIRKLTTVEEVDEALSSGLAVILKHSTLCPISRNAHRELALFLSQHPEVPVYLVDVIQNRDLSTHIEKKTGVFHQSPQAFVVRNGTVVWHETHYRIKAESLQSEIV